jgi:hypothetical protein
MAEQIGVESWAAPARNENLDIFEKLRLGAQSGGIQRSLFDLYVFFYLTTFLRAVDLLEHARIHNIQAA